MLGKLKEKLTGALFGELVRDWGEVSNESGALFNEQLSVALYEKDRRKNICLTYNFGSANKQILCFAVGDLRQFVSTLARRLDEFEQMAGSPGPAPTVGSNKLPFFQRIVATVIYGVKASRLLVDRKSRSAGGAEVTMYGYLTRRDDTKVLIQCDSGANSSLIVSAAGIRAMARALAEHVESAEAGAL
jgi:hypothetical protein